jgi:hypothetical protein
VREGDSNPAEMKPNDQESRGPNVRTATQSCSNARPVGGTSVPPISIGPSIVPLVWIRAIRRSPRAERLDQLGAVVGERDHELLDAGAHRGRAEQRFQKLGCRTHRIGRVQRLPDGPVLGLVRHDAFAHDVEVSLDHRIGRGGCRIVGTGGGGQGEGNREARNKVAAEHDESPSSWSATKCRALETHLALANRRWPVAPGSYPSTPSAVPGAFPQWRESLRGVTEP